MKFSACVLIILQMAAGLPDLAGNQPALSVMLIVMWR